MQFKGLARCSMSLASLFWVATALSAQEEGISNPPTLTMGIDRSAAATVTGVREAPGVTSRTATRQTDPGAQLELRLKQSQIQDPKKGSKDTVWLRGYADPNNSNAPSGLVAAPLIKAFPGQTVRFDIYNHLLPWDSLPESLRQEYTQAKLSKGVYEKLIPPQECDPAAHDPVSMNSPDKRPGCFNVTNNHFHGSWVNPAGNSDNVLRTLYPGAGVAHEYEYNIPADHPAGTFWYHPHIHGSTALQVASGLSGALIVNGDRWPVPGAKGQGFRSGDIDVLLSKSDGKPIPDRVFMLQQIQYKCFNPDGTPKSDLWNCAEGDIGAIVDYNNLGARNWPLSGRFTTVNGRVADMLGIGSEPGQEKVIAGQPERWRFIHAGFNDSIKVQIYPAKPNPEKAEATSLKAVFSKTSAADNDRAIARSCDISKPPLKVFEIAADGLTRYQALETDARVLQPGYRSDVLVSFPQPAGDLSYQDYCVIDAPIDSKASVEGSVDSKRLLFSVRVQRNDARPQIPDAKVVIHETLSSAAKRLAADRQRQGLDVSKLPEILADLDADLKLESFSPHERLTGQTIREQEDAWLHVDNVRLLRFSFDSVQTDAPSAATGPGIGHTRLSRTDFEAASDPDPQAPWSKVEDVRFSTKPDELIALQLGNTDEWRLRTADFAHPFHIHINPFQVVSVKTLDGSKDLTTDPTSQYFGMKDVYKDTIMVQPDVEVVVRSHYERYVGRFVLHCHILPHEDQGMMRLVEIFDPGIPGGLEGIEKRNKGTAGAAHSH